MYVIRYFTSNGDGDLYVQRLWGFVLFIRHQQTPRACLRGMFPLLSVSTAIDVAKTSREGLRCTDASFGMIYVYSSFAADSNPSS